MAKNKIMPLVLFFILILSSCGSDSSPNDVVVVPPRPPEGIMGNRYEELLEYVDVFKVSHFVKTGEEIDTSNISLEILEAGDWGFCAECVGVCVSDQIENGYRKISIKAQYWDTASPIQKRVLMFHELGHCALNRGHNEERVNCRNVSTMFPILVANKFTEDHVEKYDIELFLKNEDPIREAAIEDPGPDC